MEPIFTLQQFMFHTKNIIYGLIVLTLLLLPAFWLFLTHRDDE
jgi:di/tricarboxylate transporter